MLKHRSGLQIVFVPAYRNKPIFNPRDVDWYGKSLILGDDAKPKHFPENLQNYRKLKAGRRLTLREKKIWFPPKRKGI